MTITNPDNLNADQLLDDTIRLGRDEEAWAYSLSFDTAADYHRATDDAWAAENEARDEWDYA